MSHVWRRYDHFDQNAPILLYDGNREMVQIEYLVKPLWSSNECMMQGLETF